MTRYERGIAYVQRWDELSGTARESSTRKDAIDDARARRNLSLLPWLILPAMLSRYWQLQDLLPERIAVHFNANNVPNGW